MLDKYERSLRDLNEKEVEKLIARRLQAQPAAREVVLSIIKRVFRQSVDGNYTSLAGKPVIVTYLLELVSEPGDATEIEADATNLAATTLSEFDVYKIIMDRLMMRDQRRSMVIFADRRRRCLQQLGIMLSRQETPVAVEETFRTLILVEFATEIRRHTKGEREEEIGRYFEDLRSSCTLTSDENNGRSGWRFSHNSLREFLVVEAALRMLSDRKPERVNFPVTSAMRAFAASMSEGQIRKVERDLQDVWHTLRTEQADLGTLFVMFWDGLVRIHDGNGEKVIRSLTRGNMDMSGMRIQEWSLTPREERDRVMGCRFNGAELTNVSFAGVTIEAADFSGATLDAVDFTGATIKDTNFSDAWLVDVVLVEVELRDVDFRGIDRESVIVARSGAKLERLTGEDAIGVLRFLGGITDEVDDYYVARNHENFGIVEKIVDRLVTQSKSQYRGLTQRGEAHKDPRVARDFVSLLEREKIVEIDSHRLVGATSYGRNVLAAFKERKMPEAFAQFLLRS